MKPRVAIFWFRRVLRLEDNAGLYHALKQGDPVLPFFIFDRNILDQLENRTDRRVEFIYNTLVEMQEELGSHKTALEVFYGRPAEAFHYLLAHYDIASVYTNTDYEPHATERDKEIAGLLKTKDIPFRSYKDQVIFEKNEVLKDD